MIFNDRRIERDIKNLEYDYKTLRDKYYHLEFKLNCLIEKLGYVEVPSHTVVMNFVKKGD